MAGDFKRSLILNNGYNSDKQGISERASQARLHTTGDKYQTEVNDYKLFLNEPEELPRLSILDNYKQITRIMTNSYIKSFDEEKKFRNRSTLEVDVNKDPDYARFQEERTNTLKMSTILKTLNSPKKKRKTIIALRQRAAEEAAELAAKKTARSRSTNTKFATINQAVSKSSML